jgi:hypothetical protein
MELTLDQLIQELTELRDTKLLFSIGCGVFIGVDKDTKLAVKKPFVVDNKVCIPVVKSATRSKKRSTC